MSTDVDWSERLGRQESRHGRLLAAAATVIERKGLDFTVEDVTRQASMAKGTFYLYFESRDALLDALRTWLAEDIAQVVRRVAVGPWDGLWGRVVAAGAEWSRSLGQMHGLFRDRTSGARPPRMILMDAIRELVEAGLDQGVLSLPERPGIARGQILDTTVVAVQALLTEAAMNAAFVDPAAVAAADAVVQRIFVQQSGDVCHVPMAPPQGLHS